MSRSFSLALALVVFVSATPARASMMADQLFRQGLELAEKRQWKEAAAKFESALRFKKVFPQAHYNLGHCYHRLKRRSEALEHYKLAIEQDPKLVEAHNNLALLLEEMGRSAEAIAHYKATIKLLPSQSALLSYNLANLYFRIGKLEQAVLFYRAASLRDPRDLDSRFNLGIALIKLKRVAEAQKSFEAILTLEKRHVSAMYQLGLLRQAAGDHKGAIAWFRRILQINGKLVKPIVRMAYSLRKSGDLSGEAKALARACALGFKPACGK